MTVVSALMVPGSPLPYLKRDTPSWSAIATGYEAAGRALQAAKPDVILLYSTQWIAVLDELWQARPRVDGLHVDENWYEYGDLPFDLNIDTELANACVAGSKQIGVSAKAVDYDQFPIDTGTIVASKFLNPDNQIPYVIAANNVYHDWNTTTKLAQMAVKTAQSQGKKVAVVGVGGLSGTIFRTRIDVTEDRIASDDDDASNKKMLGLLERGDVEAALAYCPDYAQKARVDMGFKHFAWVLGGLDGRFGGAKVHAYGPTYGSGNAVVEFKA